MSCIFVVNYLTLFNEASAASDFGHAQSGAGEVPNLTRLRIGASSLFQNKKRLNTGGADYHDRMGMFETITRLRFQQTH
jgi:hypothetical protein